MDSSGGSTSGKTVLTIRAKKSDVDAFAEGELTADQFRERAGIFTYVLEGAIGAGMEREGLLDF